MLFFCVLWIIYAYCGCMSEPLFHLWKSHMWLPVLSVTLPSASYLLIYMCLVLKMYHAFEIWFLLCLDSVLCNWPCIESAQTYIECRMLLEVVRSAADQPSCKAKTSMLRKLYNQIFSYLPCLFAPLTSTVLYHFHWPWPFLRSQDQQKAKSISCIFSHIFLYD